MSILCISHINYLRPILIQIYSVDNLGEYLKRNLTACQEQLPKSDTKNNVISAFVQWSVRRVDHQKTLTQNITLNANMFFIGRKQTGLYGLMEY